MPTSKRAVVLPYDGRMLAGAILLLSVTAFRAAAAVAVTDDFSGTLANWVQQPDDAAATWKIQSGNLIGYYSISAGSPTNTQSALLLRDNLQPTDDWTASVDFTLIPDPVQSTFKAAYAGFILGGANGTKLSITVGHAEWNWNVAPRTSVDVGVQRWNGSSWAGLGLDASVQVSWNPSNWNTAKLQKTGANYQVFLNGTKVLDFQDTILNGQGKLGFHAYGPRKLDNFQLSTPDPTITYSLTTNSASYPASGGSGSVGVTVSGGAGTWSAGSNTAWISITSGASGAGSGSVSYSVGNNTTGSDRTGSLTIAGQTFTVTQAGESAVRYALGSSSANFAHTGGNGSVSLIVSGGTGTWTARSNATGWIALTGPTSGTSSATVTYSVSPNDTGASRGGTLTIAGQTFNVYQAASEPIPGTLRMMNTSTRVQVGTGANVLITGVVLNRDGAKRYLVRAAGPALENLGVPGVLPDPLLTVFSGSTLVGTNDNWDASLAPIFTSVGAFAFSSGSRDSALVVTLGPGAYTFQVSGVGGATGVALVEVYELP